jgi:hypothetical protein
MDLCDCHKWLDERIPVPEALERALGLSGSYGQPQRLIALDHLAKQMGFESDQFGCATYDVLDGLLIGFGAELPTVPWNRHLLKGSVIDFIDSGKLDRALVRAVQGQTADSAIRALSQLGRGTRELPRCQVQNLPSELEGALVAVLIERAVRMLRRWYGPAT